MAAVVSVIDGVSGKGVDTAGDSDVSSGTKPLKKNWNSTLSVLGDFDVSSGTKPLKKYWNSTLSVLSEYVPSETNTP